MEELSPINPLDAFFSQRIAAFAGVCEHKAFELLMASCREGHLCLPLKEIKEEERNFLVVNKELLKSFIRIEKDSLYLEKNWLVEQNIENEIKRLSKKKKPSYSLSSFSLNQEQRDAVCTCLDHQLTCLSGGPGTGKTYTASAIVQAFDPEQKKRIALAAPTGRAADHLSHSLFRNCGRKLPSSTIHKLLKLGSLPPWPKDQFFLSFDLIIIDECSMIDAPLFATLLKAIPDHCTVVFMGDPYQLNPVGIGSVFHDLVKSRSLPHATAHLKQSMRTESREILQISEQVLRGEMPDLPLSSLDDFAMPTDFSKQRLLNCLRVGPLGAVAYNEMALKKVCSSVQRGHWWSAPIMITSNDEEIGLFNGEIGIYKERKGIHGSGSAIFSKNQKEIPFFALPKFEWAFCSSVHKSQGSEYDEVIVIVPPGSEIFGREMLYTAITRAKCSIKIVGQKETLQAMLKRSLVKHSGLT